MRKNEQTVMDAFKEGKAKRAGNLATDGHHVWSYDHLIAHKTEKGIETLNPVNKKGKWPFTRTTCSHLRAVIASFPGAIIKEGSYL